MLSILLLISGSEIGIILIFILIFFGADKIPEIMRVLGKGAREFKKATDDIKREINDSSSGVLSEIKSIGSDLSDSFNKEISAPVHKTANETLKSFDAHRDQFDSDTYYDNQDTIGSYGNEYQLETEKKDDEIPEEQKNEN